VASGASRWQQSEDALFHNHAGGRLSETDLPSGPDAPSGSRWKDTPPHLRHTMASLLRERACPWIQFGIARSREYCDDEQYVHAVPVGQTEAAEKLEDL